MERLRNGIYCRYPDVRFFFGTPVKQRQKRVSPEYDLPACPGFLRGPTGQADCFVGSGVMGLNRIHEIPLDLVEYEETGNEDKKSRCDADGTGVK